MDGSLTEVLTPRDRVGEDVPRVEVRIIDADDSSITHWPCGISLPTRFDGTAWICPRCGEMR